MQDFKRLEVWRLAHALALNTHRLSAAIPRQDNSGLTSQMRRAATSISANIAEGAGKESRKEFARFLQIAIASGFELENHLLFCRDANLAPRSEVDSRLAETIQVRRMLFGLLKKVREQDCPVAVRSKPNN
ncbi:MAG TPA: four helix bundle protein [Gemmatimonadaceae bacterium]|jgi:four helix bundle protein|nr:four helix bundle protein [Gemmatimonadaceae bacterium]